MTTAYIAMGSNLSNPSQQLQLALDALSSLPRCRIEKTSSHYRSEALGPGEQPDYLNAVVKLQTSLAPAQLLDALQTIENNQGRVRNQHWGARTLDLDILLYGQDKIDTQRLQVPHPRMNQRNFVLYPLAEIASDKLILPCGGVLGSLLEKCPRGDLQQLHVGS